MDLDLAQLRALRAAVDTGTLEGAARALHVTPSAVSQRLKALEQATGRVLLVRSRPVQVTEPGRAVLRLARQLDLLAADAARELIPDAECLKDVVERMLPYWFDSIVPDLQAGHTVLVAAHGNSLRALVKHLDGISDDEITGLNLPTGVPIRYELDDHLHPIDDVRVFDRFLGDVEAARAAAEAVARQTG